MMSTTVAVELAKVMISNPIPIEQQRALVPVNLPRAELSTRSTEHVYRRGEPHTL